MTKSGVSTEPDPDPTPTVTPWQEYQAAAQSLDAVVREAAAQAAGPARAELSRLRERLDQQRAELVGEAVRAGLRSPPLVPTPAEQAAASARVTDLAGVADLVRECHRLLDLADAQLAAPGGQSASQGGPPVLVGSLRVPTEPLRVPTGPLPVLGGPPAPVSPSVPGGPARPPGQLPLWLVVTLPIGTVMIIACLIGILLLLLT